MRFILSIVMISALAFVFGCQTASSSSTKTKNEKPADVAKTDKPAADNQGEHAEDDAPRISLADAKKDFDAGDTIFVDTRSEDNFNTEHVKGAINVPLNDFDKSYKSIPKDKKIITYCS